MSGKVPLCKSSSSRKFLKSSSLEKFLKSFSLKNAKRGLCIKLNYLLITTLIFLFFYWPYFCHNLDYNICSSIKFQNNVNVSIHIYAASIAIPSGLNNVYALCFVHNRNVMHSPFGLDFWSRPSVSTISLDRWSRA